MQTQQEENRYLQQEVMGASPIRLRWMLIRRAEELCGLVADLWENGQESEGSGWLLRVREILGELLGGVRDASNPLGKTVADFYVFLIQLATETDQHKDVLRLGQLRMLLSIEKETWHQVLMRDERPPTSQNAVAHTASDRPVQSNLIPRTDSATQPISPAPAPRYFGASALQASAFSVDV